MNEVSTHSNQTHVNPNKDWGGGGKAENNLKDGGFEIIKYRSFFLSHNRRMRHYDKNERAEFLNGQVNIRTGID